MTDTNHLLGLLLGTEEDWPTAFESIVRRLGPVTDAAGSQHRYDVERIVIEPFDLRDTTSEPPNNVAIAGQGGVAVGAISPDRNWCGVLFRIWNSSLPQEAIAIESEQERLAGVPPGYLSGETEQLAA